MTAARPRTIDLDGPLRVVEYGDAGPPVVCVHGLGGSALDWQLLAPLLAERGRVFALDLPGFGDSPLDGRSATITRLRALLDQFLRDHVGQPAVLVGNSMGGMLAALQAFAHPSTVGRLVLLSPVLPASVRRMPHPLTTAQFAVYATPRVGEWYVRVRRRRLTPRALVDATLGYITADPDRIPEPIVEQRTALTARRSHDPTGDEAFLSAARSLLRLLAMPRRYRQVLDRVVAPVLVVHGGRDRLVSARAAVAAAGHHPDWTFELLGDVGHVPQLEAPDAVAATILGWLARPIEPPVHPAGPDGPNVGSIRLWPTPTRRRSRGWTRRVARARWR